MRLELDGRLAVVTGASTGIGLGIATAYAAAGARVVGVARDPGRLAAAVEGLPEPGLGHAALTADLSTREGVAAVLESVAGERVDIVVNNAGGSVNAPVGTPDETWERAMALQFHACRRLTEPLLEGMRARRYGRVLCIGGTFEPGPAANATAAAKAAMVLWAKGVANEVAADGVTVNTINPGRIVSVQIMERLHADPEQRARFIEERIPARRFGESAELAALALFLATPQASYITGAAIPVDGGMRGWPM